MNYIAPPILYSTLAPLSALIAMAFFTLLERKILGYLQLRKGPNKPSIMGLPQPLIDALKLFSKEQATLFNSNNIAFNFFPLMALLLALTLWALAPSPLSNSFIKFSVILFLCISAMNVYTIMGAGWASNSKYALLGALRSVAQSISYEVTLTITLLTLMLIIKTFSLNLALTTAPMFIFLAPPLVLIWLLSCLAETSRAPFDHAEGESELVSGFNTEYSGGQFALIFMAEYTNIIFLSLLTTTLTLNPHSFTLVLLITLMLTAWFIWIRATLPRVRYDKLMALAWKVYLPATLSVLTLLTPLSLVYLYS